MIRVVTSLSTVEISKVLVSQTADAFLDFGCDVIEYVIRVTPKSHRYQPLQGSYSKT